ncbi:hypothetical protein COL922a_012350 [Colletotrichum nupharicola]|nr:hypothetical protein COL922a_012350 [Colletotrichum nupharicola]
MRSSILCLALAGLSGLAQATPTTDTTHLQSEPRGLITRGLTHMFYPRQATTPTEPPPTRRQAATPPPPLTSAPPAGGGPGDTPGQIARLFNSGICDIAKLNNIPNPDFTDVNQVLQVPINLANPDNTSCLNRGGAIPPAAAPANGTATPPPPPGGKKTKRRRTNASLPAILPASHEQPSH